MSNPPDISANSFTNYKLKLHSFTPSKRSLWTIVGKNDEYWLDPELNFCTCKHYYFKTLSGKDKCQHLKILNELIKNKKYDQTDYTDEEYYDFLALLIKDILPK